MVVVVVVAMKVATAVVLREVVVPGGSSYFATDPSTYLNTFSLALATTGGVIIQHPVNGLSIQVTDVECYGNSTGEVDLNDNSGQYLTPIGGSPFEAPSVWNSYYHL